MNFGDNVKAAHDMSPGLLRQRRNLVAVSLVLIFLEFSKAKIHTFQLMGIHLTFEQPSAVLWMLFSAIVYLTYRYFVYLNQEPGPGLRKRYLELLNRYASNQINTLATTKFGSDKKFSIQEPLGTKRPGESTWKVLVALEHDSDGESKTDYLDVQFSQVWKEAIFAGIVPAITRSYFTDYVAPYLLSIFASVLFIFNVSAL